MYDYGEGGGSSSAMDNLEENRRRQQEEACGAKNSDVERDEYGFELVDLCPDAPGRAFMPQMGLQLYSERDGSIKIVPFVKLLTAGRSSECQLTFPYNDQNRAISRIHACFQLRGSDWFVWDNYSVNGTWLNGVHLEERKKYRLHVNDVIDFAHAERMVFFKNGIIV